MATKFTPATLASSPRKRIKSGNKSSSAHCKPALITFHCNVCPLPEYRNERGVFLLRKTKKMANESRKKPYRPIRKKLTESEARNKLSMALVQRQNCIEHLMSIKMGLVPPLIQALCHQSLDDMIEQNYAQIEWLDKRIEDLQRFFSVRRQG